MTVQAIAVKPTVHRRRAARLKPFDDLGRFLLRPLEWLLRNRDSPESSAATVVRLFESAHVKDLRLIAGVAFALGFYGSIVGLLLSLESAIAAAHALPKAESTQAPSAVFHQVLVCFFHVFKYFLLNVFKNFPAPLGVLAAVVAWAYQRGSARLGVVDLFACEISTLCRVATLVDTVKRCIDEYSNGCMPPADRGEGAQTPPQAFSSSEDYFPIFGANSRDLESLEARVVINITAFYTYMKAVRDMRRGLQAITPLPSDQLADTGQEPEAGSWREAMRNQIYMLFLALESARKSVEDLVEFEPEQAERTIVILTSELKAYSFLCAHYPKENDIRHKRLLLRKAGYVRETRACIRTVEAGMRSHGSRKKRLWKPAWELLAELRECCEEALRKADDAPLAHLAEAAA